MHALHRRSLLGLLGLLLVLAPPARAQEADAETRIAVAARDLPRGAVLQPSDIAMEAAPAGARAGSRAQAQPGWVTRRVIAEGERLDEPAVAPPPMVRSGDEVQLIYRDGALELRLRGRAMNAAPAGGRVTVRVDAGRRFEGIAIAAGIVRMESSSRSN